jgi:predicted MPP superfamily phosphohydrolase
MIHASNISNTINRLAWVTDIHLDFLTFEEIQAFCHKILDSHPDAILIGGDIGNAETIITFLKILASDLPCPIYFVLGNHDYYHNSINAVREEITTCSIDSGQLNWLPVTGVVGLTEQSCLIGHDGWADGRLGNYLNSTVMLNDYRLIEDLAGLEPVARLQVLNKLADEAAAFLQEQIQAAVAKYRQIILLTHVPPFKEACWYEGQLADDNWLPHFSCKAVGDMLLQQMQKYQHCSMTVLCGHTHNAGIAQMLPNLLVKTGAAEYGKPELQEILLVE